MHCHFLTAIGTIELFHRTAEDFFNHTGVIRLDLRSDFEKSGFTKSEEFMIGTNDKYAYKDYWEKTK